MPLHLCMLRYILAHPYTLMCGHLPTCTSIPMHSMRVSKWAPLRTHAQAHTLTLTHTFCVKAYYILAYPSTVSRSSAHLCTHTHTHWCMLVYTHAHHCTLLPAHTSVWIAGPCMHMHTFALTCMVGHTHTFTWCTVKLIIKNSYGQGREDGKAPLG